MMSDHDTGDGQLYLLLNEGSLDKAPAAAAKLASEAMKVAFQVSLGTPAVIEHLSSDACRITAEKDSKVWDCKAYLMACPLPV